MKPNNLSALIERFDLFSEHSSFLCVNPPAGTVLPEHCAAWSIYAHHDHPRGELDQLSATLELAKNSTNKPEAVVVFLTKEKALLLFLFAQLAATLEVGTPIYLVGENDAGIKSWVKKAIPQFAPFVKLTSGNHCQLLSTSLEAPATFSIEDYLTRETLVCPEGDIESQFLPGVFGHGRLDKGTELLLAHMPASVRGDILDFGCGSGVISHWLSRHRQPRSLTAVDISTLAKIATERSLAELTVPHKVVLSDGLQQVTGSYDWLITNPPFHQGKQHNYEMTRRFIVEAKGYLKPRGRLLMVANSFLPWPEFLKEHFRNTEVLVETRQYRVTLSSV
ncbi:MAG: class I SAM-dependent methyltransferase [Idiomarina sp.]|nr:class I SAM-dependent methyltransferase [Idiomarina sp.]